MPAARYWRVVGIETYGRGALELSALQLFGAVRLDEAALLSCSHAPDTGALAYLQDGTASVCGWTSAARAPGFFVAWDCGADVTASGLRVGAGTTSAAYLIRATLQAFVAGVWVTVSDCISPDWPGPLALGPLVGDPEFEYSVLRLHADGETTATTVPDSSAYGSVATRVGSASITPDGRFGQAFLIPNGAGSVWSVPSAPRFALRRLDFTLRCWINPLPGISGNRGIAIRDYIGGTRGWLLLLGDGTGGTTAGAVTFGLWNAPASVALNTTIIPTPGVHTFVEVSRHGDVFRLFVGGALGAEVTSSIDSPESGLPITLGALNFSGSYKSPFGGSIDDFELLVGHASHTAPYTPPDAPRVDAPGSVLPLVLPRTMVSRPAAAVAGSDVGPVWARALRGSASARDTAFGGRGCIWGTTKIKGTPSNLPTRARVVLLHQRSKLVARETWSDAVTGAFAFEDIDTQQQFLTLAEDAAGAYRPVAAHKLVPEVVS
jgi:hypothetical protein